MCVHAYVCVHACVYACCMEMLLMLYVSVNCRKLFNFTIIYHGFIWIR